MEYFFLILLGLIFGSFINVLIYRLPRQESIIFPRSHCPNCNYQLEFFDLIPVVSYFFLKGQCRKCQLKISKLYPTVEFLTALCLVLLFQQWGISWFFLTRGVMTLILIPLAIIDFRHLILPDQLTLSGLFLALLLALIGDHLTFFQAFWGMLVGGGFLLFLALLYPKGMGGGDIKLMAMVGAFLGWPFAFLAIFGGALLGLLYFGLGFLLKKVQRESLLPFGTFLAITTAFIAIYSERILQFFWWIYF